MRIEINPGLKSTVAKNLLRDGVLSEIEQAIYALPADSSLRERFVATCNETLHRLEPLALLHVEAPEVMQGDRGASRRFEILLNRIALELDSDQDPPRQELIQDFDTSLPPEDSFVQLDNLLMVALATGSIQLTKDDLTTITHGLFNLLNALTELQELHEAARIFLLERNPAPMSTLSWKPVGHRPKAVIKKPIGPKRPRRPITKARKPAHVKIKDTHGAFVSCFKNGVARAAREAEVAPRFTVISVIPNDACPGEIVTITGTNFGSVGGDVGFKGPSGSTPAYMSAAPSFWSDTTIVVTVPPWAREGPLRIYAVDHTFVSCFRRFAVNRLPDKFGPQNDGFFGGLPDIYDLRVDGKDTGVSVLPGATAIVSWATTKGDLTVDIANTAEAAFPHWTLSPLSGGVGSITWPVYTVASPTKFLITLTVKNRCGAYSVTLPVMVTVPATLAIKGIEVTQGIQNYAVFGGPSNQIPTVAGKDTIVRVYATADRGGWFNDVIPHLTASLLIDGKIFTPINGAAPGSASGGNPFLDVGYDAKRWETDGSFNFRIPASFADGTKAISVAVFGQDELKFQYASQTIMWTWHNKLHVRVRYVRVSYMGTLTSDLDGWLAAYRAFDLLPSAPLDIGPAWMPTWNTGEDLTDDDGRKTLLGHLSDQHNCTFSEWALPWEDDCPDDDGALWIGVVSADIKGKARVGESTAITCLFSFNRYTTAHELGHLLCLRHVNQGCNGDNPDPSGSCFSLEGNAFDDLPNAGQIVEVPFDPYFNTIITAPRYDFMSYGCQRWISDTNWMRLFNDL